MKPWCGRTLLLKLEKKSRLIAVFRLFGLSRFPSYNQNPARTCWWPFHKGTVVERGFEGWDRSQTNIFGQQVWNREIQNLTDFQSAIPVFETTNLVNKISDFSVERYLRFWRVYFWRSEEEIRPVVIERKEVRNWEKYEDQGKLLETLVSVKSKPSKTNQTLVSNVFLKVAVCRTTRWSKKSTSWFCIKSSLKFEKCQCWKLLLVCSASQDFNSLIQNKCF